MSELIRWGLYDPTIGRITGLTTHEYIEVRFQYVNGEFEFMVRIWSQGQSTGQKPSHEVIGRGELERGKQAAQELLNEGLERF